MAELDNLQGGGQLARSRNPYEYDEFAARHSRIVNEYENFIEDKGIVDQQTVRLSEDQTNSETLMFMQVTYVRKIKSNIENIL